MNKNFQNQFSGLIFLILALSTVFWLIPTSVHTPQTLEIGPQLWPYLVSWLIAITAVALIILEGKKRERKKEEKEESIELLKGRNYRIKPYALKPIAFPFLGGLYIYFIEKLGFILATILMLPVFLVYFGSRNHKANIVIAVVGTLLIYVVFVRFLKVQLPYGILPPLF